MALYYIPKIHFSWQTVLPFSVGGLILLIALLFFGLAKQMLQYNKQVLGALVMSCGFGNVSFLGYPLVEAYYGKKGIETAVLIDQGTFLVLVLIGVPLAMLLAGKQISAPLVFRKLITFPSFGAFLIALAFNISGFELGTAFESTCKRLADTLTPLALFSVGWQMQFRNLAVKWQYWVIGLFYKLFLAPLIFFVCIGSPFTLGEQVVILQAAMAPMITSSLIASEQGLAPALANFLVSIGIPISLLSTWVWHWAIAYI